MTYQHPLAFVLGIEGAALLRTFAGEFDREFVEARIAEIRDLLDKAAEVGEAVELTEISTVDGYRAWSATYDQPGNGLIELEQPIVREILDELPAGVALDAACGTGRHAEYLVARGHQVVGVDSSPDMLARARERVPRAEFLDGDLRRLPLTDESVDLVVCALALAHVSALAPVFAEFARVLRPGGHVVVSDPHAEGRFLGPVAMPLPDGRLGHLPASTHLASDYLAAALPLGFQVRRCDEPRRPPSFLPSENDDYSDEPWPWGLPKRWCREAAAAVFTGIPGAIVWHFQLAVPRS